MKAMLRWRVARVVHSEPETESAQTIGLTVPGWGGHLAGQHVDLKLTAEDGYSAQRSYSLSRPADGERIELTVQQIADGEVSPYLTGLAAGDEIELRGPIGGWFVWRPEEEARVLLVGGGSGIVPLMAMLRQRVSGRHCATFGWSTRCAVPLTCTTPKSWVGSSVHVTGCRSRWSTPAWPRRRPPGRPAGSAPLTSRRRGGCPPTGSRVYVCGPTGFVESVTTTLVEQGLSAVSHPDRAVRTEQLIQRSGE